LDLGRATVDSCVEQFLDFELSRLGGEGGGEEVEMVVNWVVAVAEHHDIMEDLYREGNGSQI